MTRPASLASLALAFGVFAAATGRTAPSPAPDSVPEISVVAPDLPTQSLTAANLMKQTQVTVAIPGKSPAVSYAGPLLWQVLDMTHVLPSKPREQVSRIVLVTGADGYSVAVALGEIAPEFENKPVILADQMNGKPLPAGHLRLVVPADQRAGRSVRDVVRIELRAESAKP